MPNAGDALLDEARRLLRRVFGYHAFRDQQEQIVAALLDGEDALVLMPTGGGKSLCYQIPSLLREGTGVVVSPLIALMQDQVEALRRLGVRAAFLNSSLSGGQRAEVARAYREGALDLLYVAPERLLMEHTLHMFDARTPALFAIDEAHCVSQWGHDFRPEYRQLLVLHQRYPGVPRIALTATADARTQQEIVQQLDLAGARVFRSSFDRPNIRYLVHQGGGGREALWRFLQREHREHAGIVYCPSRKNVEETARWLAQKGRKALPYHAGMPSEQRQRNQQRFLREDALIVVATIAFGMGIDKPDVRFVAHLHLPRNIEAYYQETGRAGRDGETADAWLSYTLQDVARQRAMLEQSEADEAHKRLMRHKLNAMIGLCEMPDCRRRALLAYFGERREEPCGNCDNCLNPPRTWDGTEAAQKALSCVVRTGQSFGVQYLTQVLLGKDDARIRRHGHHRLSTFGIGGEHSARAWHGIFRQLVAQGYLRVDMDAGGALRLAGEARALLRGELRVRLSQQQTPSMRQAIRRTQQQQQEDEADYDHSLFAHLRALRLQYAKEEEVPPFFILHDRTLKALAREKPSDLEAMGQISGIGEQKLARYGRAFLDAIAGFRES